MKVLVIILLIALGILYASTLHSYLGLSNNDDAQYIILAKALASGQGYRSINYPYNPLQTVYPFIFPLLLTPIVYFFGYNFLLMRILILFFGLGSLYLIYWMFRQKKDEEFALLCMLLVGISPILYFYQTIIISEIPYIFFSLLALFFIESYANTDSVLNKYLFISCGFTIISFFTRMAGISIFLGAFFYLFLKKRLTIKKINFLKKVLVFVVICGLPFFSWIIMGHSPVGRSFDYTDQFFAMKHYDDEAGIINFIDLFSRVKNNFKYYANALVFDQFFIYYKLPAALRNAFALFFMSLFVFGFLEKLIIKKSIFEFYFLFYCLLFLSWPFQEMRFLVPILPFSTYYLVSGLITFASRIKKVSYLFLVITLSVIILFDFLGLNYISKRFIRITHGQSPVYKWVIKNVPLNSVIIYRFTATMFLLTGRKTILYPWTNSDNRFFRYLRMFNIDYVIVDKITTETVKYLIPFIEKYPEIFTSVAKFRNSEVFKIEKAKIKLDEN
ncbi:MAG: glycosyltransferase family 39 protein [Candidatus Omnitrophota bacterium]